MLRDKFGYRKYLTPTERSRFLAAAEHRGGDVGAFCALLCYTGCRISEALELTSAQIDWADQAIVFRSLKKRREDHYRAVPVPEAYLAWLTDIGFQLPTTWQERLWAWSRTTGWARIKETMVDAEIIGRHASPKGLRHGFGVAATQRGVPLNIVQRWLGHASIEMTAIYADAIGEEERALAARLWERDAA